MDENIIEVRDLHYTYSDGTQALKGVSLCIKRGQTTAFLGGNGAGKSTLFLSLNGVLMPSAGTLLLGGNPYDYSPRGLKRLRSTVGIVFQDSDSQLFSANVYRDISFGAVNLKLPDEEVRTRVELAMEKLKISHLRDKPTHSLSFGQKKRVAIAGVLVMEPQILILDEPTAGLDPKGVSELMKVLEDIRQENGMTVILATHDVDIIPLYSDYVYVMDSGKMLLEGTSQEVFKEAARLRDANLRLPRIGHLMEILRDKDGFEIGDCALTISKARKALKELRLK